MAKKKRGNARKAIVATADELTDGQLEAVGGGAGLDGISYLVAVTQMKANNANEQATQGAETQRDLVQKKLPR